MKRKSAIPASLRKRLLALLCAVCLCVTLLPVSVLAEEEDTTDDTTYENSTALAVKMETDENVFYTDTSENLWVKKADSVSLAFEISDDGSGDDTYSIALGGTVLGNLHYIESAGTYTYEINYDELSEGANEITVKETDNEENETAGKEKNFTIYKDGTAPTAKSVTLEYTSNIDKTELNETFFMQSTAFGNFLRQSDGVSVVQLTVTATDDTTTDNGSSGLASIEVQNGNDVSATGTFEEGKAVIVLPIYDERTLLTENVQDTLKITLTDNVGNTAPASSKTSSEDNLESDAFLYDTTVPSVTETTENGSYYTVTAEDMTEIKWVVSDQNLTFTVSDEAGENGKNASGLYSTLVTVKSESSEKTVVDKTYNDNETTSATYTDTVTISYEDDLCDGENLITITVTDNAGNPATKTFTVYKDTAAPTATQVELALTATATDLSSAKDVLNSLTFGNFFNAEVTLTVTAADGNGSGLDYMVVSNSDGTEDKADFKGYSTASVTLTVNLLSAGKSDELTITLTDNVGNTSTTKVSEINSDLSDSFLYETERPTVTETTDGNSYYTYTTGEGESAVKTLWVKDGKDLTFIVSDVASVDGTDASGLYSTLVTVKSESSEKTVVDKTYNDNETTSATYTDTVTISYEDDLCDGENLITITVTDNAGNESDPFTLTVYKDTVAPTASEVKLTLNSETGVLRSLEFGNFFNADVTLTVTASDGGSGLASMTVSSSTGESTASFGEDGTASVTLIVDLLNLDKSDKLTIAITDNVGNTSEAQTVSEINSALNDLFLYETTDSVVKDTTNEAYYAEDSDGNLWVKDGKTLTFTLTDVAGENGTDASGLYSVVTTVQSVEDSAKSSTVNKTYDDATAAVSTDTVTISYGDLYDGENLITITVTDNAGNETAETFTVYKDTQTPVVDSVTVGTISQNLTFGAYSNKAVQVTVTLTDGAYSSGIQALTMSYGGVSYQADSTTSLEAKTAGDLGVTAQFTLPYTADLEDALTVSVTDCVGHSAVYTTAQDGTDPAVEQTNLQTGLLMLETTAATGTLKISDSPYTENGRNWYGSKAVTVEVSVSDVMNSGLRSGLASVDLTLNGVAANTSFDYTGESGKTVSDSWSFTLNHYWADSVITEGENTLTILVTDNAGNSDTVSLAFYIDTQNPVVTGFDFTATGGTYNLDGSSGELVTTTVYGYYFSQDTDVTVSVSDAANSSGIRIIYFYTLDVDGTGTLQTKTINGGANTAGSTAETAVFTVKAGFKGQIYACVADNTGHVQDHENGTNLTVNGFTGSFVNPEGLIVETAAMHAETSAITITLPSTSCQDASGNNLYSGNTNVAIQVSDTYSGIRSVEVTVESPNDTGSNTSYTLTVSHSGTLSDSSWSANATGLNLVTNVFRTITVTNNSNDIKITVKLTDNAGNTSTEEAVLSIDKDAPVVTVSYDNNAALNDKYFNEDRVMTITVVERNFNGAEVDCTVDGTAVSFGGSLAEWTVSGPDGDGNYTYTLTRTFHNDGDYLFAMSVTDLADNLTADAQVSYQGTATQDFVMDQTAPVISLSLNGAFSNGYYLQADSSVTVTVNEHNFDAGGYTAVARFVSASDATDTFLAAGTWSTTGDVSTVTFDVAVEGDYYIDTVTFTDLAGNEQTVTGEEFGLGYFVLDKTAPVIQILTGVGGESIDKTASQGEVTPTIVIEDYTFNSAAVEYTLTGYRNGDVTDAYAASRSDEETGCTIIYVNFDEEETVDDIYVLTVTVTDLAGNSTPASATFSVNRFGSTYMLSQDTYDTIQSTYLNEEKTITVVEINPDRLTEQSVTVTRGSNTATLTEGEDYTVEEEGPWDSQADTWNTDSHWYQYTYTIAASNFVTEGEYTISLYSEDEADNSQTNEKTRHTVNLFSGEMNTLVTSEDENPAQAQVTFVIDKTSPIVSFLNLDKSSYRASSLDVSIQATDETKIADLEIWVDGELMETVDEQTLAQDGYTYVYTMASKGQRQSIELVAHDQAGNSSVLTDDNSKSVLITTNLWIQFINSWLAITIACVVVAAAAAGIILLLWRRRKEDEETENV